MMRSKIRFACVSLFSVPGPSAGSSEDGSRSTATPVVLIARGAHYEAIRERGLRLESPDGVVLLRLPVVDHPSRASRGPTATSSFSPRRRRIPRPRWTSSPLPRRRRLPSSACRTAWRTSASRSGSSPRCTACSSGARPATLTPGVVQAWCAPTSGILDVGRYPSGSHALAACRRRGVPILDPSIRSRSDDIMRWKYRKLLSNLGNAVEALCGSAPRGSGHRGAGAHREAIACLEAAGISFVSDDEEDAASRERELRAETDQWR